MAMAANLQGVGPSSSTCVWHDHRHPSTAETCNNAVHSVLTSQVPAFEGDAQSSSRAARPPGLPSAIDPALSPLVPNFLRLRTILVRYHAISCLPARDVDIMCSSDEIFKANVHVGIEGTIECR